VRAGAHRVNPYLCWALEFKKFLDERPDQGGHSTLKQYRTRAMKTKTCPDCNGDGVVDKGEDSEHQCPTCGGSGVVPDDDDDEEVIRTTRA
jgi:DnaJ-class molecular chaperone